MKNVACCASTTRPSAIRNAVVGSSHGPQTMPRKLFPCTLKTNVWAAGPVPDDHVPAMPSAARSGVRPDTRKTTSAAAVQSKRFIADPFH